MQYLVKFMHKASEVVAAPSEVVAVSCEVHAVFGNIFAEFLGKWKHFFVRSANASLQKNVFYRDAESFS
jgi:hypothetical protein